VEHGYRPDRGHQSRTTRRARTGERLPPAQLAELLSHVTAAIDRYRAGEIDAYAMDETIHHYHRAAAGLWKLCFAHGGGSHAEFIAGILDDMSAREETIDWWERATPQPRQ
jgi:hypothetical protein